MPGESSSSLPHWTSCRLSLRHREVRLLASVIQFQQPGLFRSCAKNELPCAGGPPSLYPGAKRSERQTDHPHPSSVKLKACVELYLHSPTRLHGVVLKAKGQCYLHPSPVLTVPILHMCTQYECYCPSAAGQLKPVGTTVI